MVEKVSSRTVQRVVNGLLIVAPSERELVEACESMPRHRWEVKTKEGREPLVRELGPIVEIDHANGRIRVSTGEWFDWDDVEFA